MNAADKRDWMLVITVQYVQQSKETSKNESKAKINEAKMTLQALGHRKHRNE